MVFGEGAAVTPKEETIDALRFWQAKENTDLAHTEADEILCWFLREIGHSDVVDEWSKVCNRATCSLSRGGTFMRRKHEH